MALDATAFQKIMVRAALDDPAVVEYEYQVRIADSAEATGHDEVCPALREALQSCCSRAGVIVSTELVASSRMRILGLARKAAVRPTWILN